MRIKRMILMCAALVPMAVMGQRLPYMDASLTPSQRADDLCSRLTVEEKISLMMNNSPAIPRLGIPQFEWWNEALHGVGRNGTATVFPVTIGMAASWNDSLVYRVFCAVSDEARAKNTYARRTGSLAQYRGLSFWTPNINIFRDPRWGRGQETYGEDPYLTSRMGLAVVRGLQGDSYAPDGSGRKHKYVKLLACAKHFAVHSGPEWSRHRFNVEDLPARDLWETYLPAFKSLVVDGGVREVMCAYQRIDGEPCCGNTRYLQQILRGEWGFKGLVTSDCGAVSDFWQSWGHGFSDSQSDASARALVTGTDLECGSDYRSLGDALKQGKVSEKDIDTSLKRLLKARFELGDFDADELVEWTRLPVSVVACSEHRQLAADMARQTMTLLSNDGILPLEKDGLKIAVLGPNANDSTMLWGNYNGFPVSTVTIWQGIKAKVPSARLIEGCGYLHNNDKVNASNVAALAGDADVVIFVGGISPRLEGEELQVEEPGFRGGDRLAIELPASQSELVKALCDAGKKVVMVNCSGSAVALTAEHGRANAILQAWYGGEHAGTAVADVLFGDYNPGGKLPVTFYAGTAQLPEYEDYRMEGRTYRYFSGKPLYPFGYGLSYTTFAISKPKYRKGVLTVKVKNTGERDGDEVVQVYVRNPKDTDGPLKTLRAFRRVRVKAGESADVSISLPRSTFELWDEETNTMRVVPGKYVLMVGNSSADEDLRKITVKVR